MRLSKMLNISLQLMPLCDAASLDVMKSDVNRIEQWERRHFVAYRVTSCFGRPVSHPAIGSERLMAEGG